MEAEESTKKITDAVIETANSVEETEKTDVERSCKGRRPLTVNFPPISDSRNSEAENSHFTASFLKLEEENRLIQQTLQRLTEESALLRELFHNTSNELQNLKKPALLVAEIVHLMKNKAIIRLPNGNKFYCNIAQEVKPLQIGDSVLVEQRSLNVIEKVGMNSNFDVERFVIVEKPKETWEQIGGLREKIQEMKEVIELPLLRPEVFEKIGIQPPKGILLHGPPGTGKTLLAKAVAQSTQATFIEVVASELVQKFIGEGAKLVKEIFEYARMHAPAIIFIDEIDAVAAVRMENGTSGEREVNRTFMQLLAELDGFACLDKVKVIAATNRPDIIDHALLRPGRLDRLLEIGLPDQHGRKEILNVHSKKMNTKKLNIDELIGQTENFSGAEIKAICTEAGYFAIRDHREFVTQQDFLDAVEKVRWDDEEDEGEVIHG